MNMVSISIENKQGFNIIGVKTWIPGTDNNMFGEFWKKCHTDGIIEQISKFNIKKEISVTKSAIIGFSCTEKDPNVRSFNFYIAVETNENENQGNYELLNVKPYRWAIFSSKGNDITALMECEMYAWKEWLPKNGTYIHDNGPEMEAYFQENKIEYWIPVREK
jgi:AraC family transcriptional regulator